MKKILLSIFLITVFLLDFSSAVKLSPTQTEIYMTQYETNCTNIWILPHENFTITSKWSNDGRGDLSRYTLTSEKIKLKINYSYLSDGKYEICFTPNRGGNFSGIIYFYDSKSMIEIGSWFDLKIEQAGAIKSISLITGNAVGSKNKVNLGLGLVFVLLFIVLLLVIRKVRE